MSSPIPASTLANRLAGFSGDAELAAEEAGRLTRLLMAAFGQFLAMLAGFAARFAAGTLPVPQPRVAGPSLVTPTRSGAKAVDARRVGYARNGAAHFEGGFTTEVPTTGTSATGLEAPETMRAPDPDKSVCGIGEKRVALRARSRGSAKKRASGATVSARVFHYDIITKMLSAQVACGLRQASREQRE